MQAVKLPTFTVNPVFNPKTSAPIAFPGLMNSSNNLQKLRKFLEGRTGKAIMDYNMIEDGDTILVCISGGKI